jgi:subtilase family protein
MAVVSALALALTAASAGAMSVPAGDGNLSSRLAQLAMQPLRSAPPAKQARALGLAPTGPGSLLREGERVLVNVRFGGGAAAGLDALRAAGARVVHVSRRYQGVTAAVRPADLRAVGAVPRVSGVAPILTPLVFAEAGCPSGATVSEGDEQLHAAQARSEFPVDGSGVTVGILSDSFDRAEPVETDAADDAESGDLPGLGNPCTDPLPTNVLADFEPNVPAEPEEPEPTDEGRAMTQIVHDLAPKADLAFATAFEGEESFAENIEALAEPMPGGAGADVIADDVTYFEEPFFQDGPVANAVNKVSGEGVLYFSAAGNDNLFDVSGNEIASWETPQYRDAGSCPPAIQSLASAHGSHCLDFNPGSQTDRTLGIKVAPGAALNVDLQWDEPWFGVGADLDAFLLDAAGNLITASGEDNAVTQKPFEFVHWVNKKSTQQTVQLVVNRFSGASPRLKLALLENGSGVRATEYPTSAGGDVVGPTVFGHSGSAGAIAVGAVPFNDGSVPEEYSSRGPTTHRFAPVEGTKAAEPLSSPEVLAKPEVAATDCGVTTFFSSFVVKESVWRFCGTSAAAPHAAGVAALMLDAEPSASAAEVRSALLASAVPVGEFGPCAVGEGMVEAVGAIEELKAPTGSPGPECEPPDASGSGEDARAAGDWGSEGTVSQPGSAAPPATTTTPPVTTTVQRPPRTFFRQRPRKLIRSQRSRIKVVFLFGSNVSDATFACRIDGGLFRVCPRRLARRFGDGWHGIQVVARDPSGSGDPTPAVYRFRVKRVG